MEKLHSNTRIMCNAEPFGFGPSAAIAQIASALRPHVAQLEYVGTGHTLELQQQVNYDHIHQSSDIQALAKPNDIFITAMDFDMARKAKAAGCRVIVYDALAWYWKQFPQLEGIVDLYFAQNFFGVTEQLLKRYHQLPPSIIVPPLVHTAESTSIPRVANRLVVNFGGISNPYFETTVGSQYVQTCINSFEQVPYEVICLGSARYRPIITSPQVTYHTVDYPAARELMHTASALCITPGLGNIYDAAALDTPIILLPPLNDSQGMQLRNIQNHVPTSLVMDWSDLGFEEINYSAEQSSVMQHIKTCVAALSDHYTDLHTQLQQKLSDIRQYPAQFSFRALLEEYGSNGSEEIAKQIGTFINHGTPENGLYQTVRREDKEVFALQGYQSAALWKFNITADNR